MIALIQRVIRTSITMEDEVTGGIDPGPLALLDVERDDDEQKTNRLHERVFSYQIFGDTEGKMNLNVQQSGGGVSMVSQFMLATDAEHGMRPGLSKGTAPNRVGALYKCFVERYRQQEVDAQTGRFATDIQIPLVSDGPVTFWLQVWTSYRCGRGQQEGVRLRITFERCKQRKNQSATIDFTGRYCVNLCIGLEAPDGVSGVR